MRNDNSSMFLLLFFIVIIYIFYQIKYVDIRKPQPAVYIDRPRPVYIPIRQPRHRQRKRRIHPQPIHKVTPFMPLVRPEIKK